MLINVVSNKYQITIIKKFRISEKNSKKLLTNPNLCGIIPLAKTKYAFADLCNGSTADSDSVCEGSNPSSAARKKHLRKASAFFNEICPCGQVK